MNTKNYLVNDTTFIQYPDNDADHYFLSIKLWQYSNNHT